MASLSNCGPISQMRDLYAILKFDDVLKISKLKREAELDLDILILKPTNFPVVFFFILINNSKHC